MHHRPAQAVSAQPTPELVRNGRQGRGPRSVDACVSLFHLKFATDAFLPALARSLHLHLQRRKSSTELRAGTKQNILGSGPFKFAGIRHRPGDERGAQPRLLPARACPISTASPAYLHRRSRRSGSRASPQRPAQPWSSAVCRTFDTRRTRQGARRQAVVVQESDWNCGSLVTPNQPEKAIRRSQGAPRPDPGDRPLAWRTGSCTKIASMCCTVGGIVFPGSPLAASKEELEQIAGFWPDIEKSRAEARRLLKEAGAEGLSFELLNRAISTSPTNMSAPG